MVKRHLVTRPAVDQEPFVSELKDMGREILLSPVFDIEFFEGKALNFSNVQAILITSANGVRALCHKTNNLKIPIYCVGDSSAQAARQAGFEQVVSANGDVSDLAERVISDLSPNGGTLLHPAASKLAGDLGGILEAGGFSYQREILYEAKAIEQLSADVISQIKSNEINEISFFSPRSSKIFSRLLKQAELERKLKSCKAYCLSPAVAKYLEQITGLEIAVSEQPTRQSLLKLIATYK
ncbi:uroporphyrinogen-III synthase [Kiloniella sp.]|uniref:uroporphyrinogen-III synthase n=1 Tax=Kiloniella sp. TaxID=1938587 RepID=UPI003B017E6F